jgi:Lon protease-like protein
MNSQEEKEIMEELTAKLSVPPEPVVKLASVAGKSFDDLSMADVTGTQRHRTIAVDPDTTANVQLSGEWVSDDWDKVAAYAMHRMTYEQFMAMMEKIEKKAETLRKEHPSWDDVTVVCRAQSAWAKETYNK